MQVTAKVDYVKPAEDGYEQRVCVTLIADGVYGRTSGRQGKRARRAHQSDGGVRRWTTCGSRSNMGEAIVSKGLAGVLRHRQDDDNRSSAYDQLLVAEDRYEAEQQRGSVGSFSVAECCRRCPRSC